MTLADVTADDVVVGPRSDRPKRRAFTAQYKAAILAEYDAADRSGRGAILRREGLYTSHIAEWRKAADTGALAGLAPAAKDRRDREIEQLRARAEKAEAELARTRAAPGEAEPTPWCVQPAVRGRVRPGGRAMLPVVPVAAVHAPAHRPTVRPGASNCRWGAPRPAGGRWWLPCLLPRPARPRRSAGLPVSDWTTTWDTAPLDTDGDGGPDTVALGLPASTTATTGSGPLTGTWTTRTTGYTPRYQATGTTRTLPDGPDVAGLPRTWTVAMRYRGNGDPDRTTLPPVTDPTTGRVLLPAEEVVTGYDTYGRPATVLGAGAHVAGTVYTPAGQPALSGSEPAPGAGTWTTTRYDGAGRPARTAWHTTAPDGTIAQALVATTSHDPAGNPTRTTTTDSSGTSTGAVDRVCSAYDALARLTATWTPPTPCPASAPGAPDPGALDPGALDPANPHALAESWVFDPGTGLPTTTTSTDATGTTTTALDHRPGTHQTAATTTTGPGGPGGGGAVVRGFTWQPDGTPATWTGPDGTTWTTTSSTTGTTTTLTSTSGPGGSTRIDRAVAPDGTILAEHTTGPAGTSLQVDLGPIGRITITTSPSGQETVTGQRDHRHPDGTLATTRTGPALTDTWAWHTGTHGTPTAAAATTMLDGTAPTGRRWWTAYGAPRGPPDTTSGPAATGWLGRPQHPTAQAATGLTRLGARDHDPTLGAFTTPDPVTAYGDPAALDPYTYSSWNPITSSDPTGLWPDWGKLGSRAADAGRWAWKHKAAIAGTVAGFAVGAAACAVTAGLGCVLIGGALAGAAASATTYGVEVAQGTRTWNTRDFLTTTATGAIGGAAGRLAATAARAAARTPAATQLANRATSALRNTRSTIGTAATTGGLRAGRQAYVDAARGIADDGLARLAVGESEEAVARSVVDARNALKVSSREGIPGPLRRLAEWRNTRKYDNPVGPTYEQLIDPLGATNERIIEHSGTTSRWINWLMGVQ